MTTIQLIRSRVAELMRNENRQADSLYISRQLFDGIRADRKDGFLVAPIAQDEWLLMGMRVFIVQNDPDHWEVV